MTKADVGDFVDFIADTMQSIATLGLTKGQNLRGHIFFEEQGKPSSEDESVSIYDNGYTDQSTSPSYSFLAWSVAFVAIRDTRSSSVAALRPIVNELLRKRSFSGPGFSVKSVEVDTSPEFVARIANNRFQAQAVLLFRVIPTG